MKPELIESSSQMDELITRITNEKLIAVDTEFFRETSYYPKLALVQIATNSIVACIDPLAFDAKPALQKILLDENTTKIFHSCSQDLEVLYYYLGEAPTNIYDTQIANALLTDHHQIGYASLVENELGTLLDKSQTRTNWLQRPLTEKQVQYAGDDVLYLYQLQKKLDEKLIQLDRKSWFNEDSNNLIDLENDFQVDSKQLWKRVKGSNRLSRDKLAIVQSIALWRENIAKQKDKTRRKILADDIIIQLALEPPKNAENLNHLTGPRYNLNNIEKQQLFEAVESAINTPADSCPDNRFSLLENNQKQLLKNLQQIVTKKAEELGISSAVLCSKKDLEKLILFDDTNNISLQPSLSICMNWRYHCIGQQLIETIKNVK